MRNTQIKGRESLFIAATIAFGFTSVPAIADNTEWFNPSYAVRFGAFQMPTIEILACGVKNSCPKPMAHKKDNATFPQWFENTSGVESSSDVLNQLSYPLGSFLIS